MTPAFTPSLSGSDPEQKRQQLLDYFQTTWQTYEQLFTCLTQDNAWTTKAIPLRHPLIFYYAHTATFFINKLMAGGYMTERIDERMEAMMAIGVDEMSWDDLNDDHYHWPTPEAVQHYRDRVRETVIDVIAHIPLTLPIGWDDPAWAILMGIEHERIHLETSSVLIRQLPINWVTASSAWTICPHGERIRQHVPKNTLLHQDGGQLILGKRDDYYGWDNEYGRQTCNIAPFSASKMLVSQAEFYEFVQEGGYQNSQWWDDEGWGWKTYTNADKPTFWVGDIAHPEQLKLRVLAEEIPLPWDWPVEVNQLEASAFCRWKSAKTGRSIQLPSEGEWAWLREQVTGDHPDWQIPIGNINLQGWASSCPVDYFKQGEFFDIVGNVWQWTTTPINGYPGFNVHPLYDDFSTPTFDGKHNLIKGGSWISTGNEALKASRYAFRRHFFQHAGFRYVESVHQETMINNPYETDTMVAQYLDFQYGERLFSVENYAKALVEKVIPLCRSTTHALDLGCATGRASFELSRYFDQVTGIDYSARFIDVALQLMTGEGFRYALPTEGELVDYRQIRLTDIGITAEQWQKVNFQQGDACNLKMTHGEYDLIFASNLIDRLREPTRFLNSLSSLLKSGGVLMLSSPYTWLEEYTPKENWLGGIRENGEAVTTYQALQRLLRENFEEIQSPEDVPFVIRETARKHQYTLAQASYWRRK
nr:5-histidylcysteine sulfoxide synthase [Rosenbergiella australiborealis]